jgi:Tfp pilus assembly protein PilV
MRRQESGFMLVELLMAILILAVGVLTLMNAFDSSRRLTSVGEKQDVIAQVADQQLEKVLSLPYSQIALNANPSCSQYSDDPNPSPNSSVSGCSSGPFTYTWSTGNSETVIVDQTNGQVTPALTETTPSPTGGTRLKLYVYTYVTATSDPLCSGCVTGTSGENFRRITVAVTSNPPLVTSNPGGTSLNKPVIVSSVASNPCAAASGSNVTCVVP